MEGEILNDDIAHKILNDRENGAALLLSEYKKNLYTVALALCHDTSEAEDLVFRAIERAISKIDTFKKQDSLYSWLCVILVNLYRDSIRKKVVKGTVPVGGAAEMEPLTEPVGPESIMSEIDGGFVRQALENLPKNMREVLILHYFMDMSTVKIAKFLAQPVGTVKSRLHYARLVLGAKLGARLKKTSVALIAAGLFLTAAATAMVVGIAASGDEWSEETPAAVSATDSGTSASSSDLAGPQGTGSSEQSGISESQQQNKKGKTMRKTITLGSLFRKAASGISTLAMTLMAVNATYGADPYIESDGTSGISTGYRMNGTSRLEVDFAMVDVSDTSTWNECRIFGTDNSAYEPTLQTCLYATYTAANDNKYFRLRAKTSASSSQPTKYKPGVDNGRHTAVFDLPNAKMVFMTGGVTNSYNYSDGGTDKTVDAGVSFAGQESTMPLSLFGRWSNAYATTFANMAKARIYGVKIYESDELVRDFVPCLKDGVACFKDLVNGGFIIGENPAAFTTGGDVTTFADDAYVSTAANADGGKLYFDTGYKTTDKSAVAIDCALTVNRNLGGSIWRLFQEGSGNIFDFNLNGNHGLRFQANGTYKTDFTTAFKDTLYDDKDVRRTFYLDNRGTAAVVTSGYTNQLVSFTQSSSVSHSYSLRLASNWANNNDFAAIKIYGCKIWENGALVRNFEPYVNNGTPGLRDTITGAFITASRGSGDTTSALAYGGTIVEDAYIEPTGSVGINTGVKLNGRSRLEVDFSLTVTNANTKNWRVFGTDTQEANLKTWLGYDSAFNTRMEMAGNNRYPIKADTVRHLAGMNMTNGSFLFVTGTTTNALASVTTDLSELEASLPLPLFGRYSNPEGSAYHNYTVPKARIYSVRIYESDALAHEFIPYSRGGVVGFYDTVTGDVISNGSSFTFGGKGQDYGQLKAYIKPDYDDVINHGEATTLTAYAPGATSYRWLCDGEPVEGGADGTLQVLWSRGGEKLPSGLMVHDYQVVAVYGSGDAARESEPSATVTINCRQLGTTLVIR